MEDLLDVTEPVPVDPTERVVLVQPLRELVFEEEPTVETHFTFMDDADTEPTYTGLGVESPIW